jgi:S-adenosylmethionine-diacylgycerolhomoserine-N-methlytransferase
MIGDKDHAVRMDSVYRLQRHVYDFTRKYYLFGRDQLIERLELPGDGQGTSVLEIACGTGRNLALVNRAWPKASLFGIDISAEMLKTARARLGPSCAIALADATNFDPEVIFGRRHFDRIIMSYCASMIPPWREAIAHAAGMIAPNGSLHIVDFGSMEGLPLPVRSLLRFWLARFHVTPRSDLQAAARHFAMSKRLTCNEGQGIAGYYQTISLFNAKEAGL